MENSQSRQWKQINCFVCKMYNSWLKKPNIKRKDEGFYSKTTDDITGMQGENNEQSSIS